MLTGLQGSIVAHTILSQPEQSTVAQAFYRSRQLETVAQHCDLATQYYADQRVFAARPFWQGRAVLTPRQQTSTAPARPGELAADTPITLARSAQLVEMPCIQGDLVKLARAHAPGD